MHTSVPVFVGVSVQATTDFCPMEPQEYDSRLFGSTIRTSQSITPFQFGIGVDRKLKRCPTAGWKSFSISHCLSSSLCVRARQIFSGGCCISRSITRVRVVSVVIGPSLSVGLRGD